MIALQQVNIRELDRTRIRFKLPSFYYLALPYIPVEYSDLPCRDDLDFQGAVHEKETIAETFTRKELAGKRVYFEKLERPEGIAPLRIIPGGWNWHEGIIVSDDFAWGDLAGELMSHADMSQTELSPIGVAKREDILTFLSQAGLG